MSVDITVATLAEHRGPVETDDVIVTPGEVVTNDDAFMRGHGTYVTKAGLTASVSGIVVRVNKLISVKSLHARYAGHVGDVVVGRIVEVGASRWRVDIASRQLAALQLSSVILPGGAQRRRTVEDQLQMRALYEEGDIISAEVQTVLGDGSASLHTRSFKYGKLENGQLEVVPAVLVPSMKQHFVTLPCGVDVIFGRNGFIWITVGAFSSSSSSREQMLAEVAEAGRKAHAERPIGPEEREKIALVANVVRVLSTRGALVSDAHVAALYDLCRGKGWSAKDLLAPAVAQEAFDLATADGPAGAGGAAGGAMDEVDVDALAAEAGLGAPASDEEAEDEA